MRIFKTQHWWENHVRELYNKISFDGLWIDMNEPASFTDMDCPNNNLNYPPWKWPEKIKFFIFFHIVTFSIIKCSCNFFDPIERNPSAKNLFSKTICPSYMHGDIPHYNLHNLYGLDHAITTRKTLLNLDDIHRPFLLARSTSLTSGDFWELNKKCVNYDLRNSYWSLDWRQLVKIWWYSSFNQSNVWLISLWYTDGRGRFGQMY